MKRPSFSRRLAALLLRWAAQIWPSSRQGWIEAMRSEVEYIEDDRQALRWAYGCFLAACKVRFEELTAMERVLIRLIVVLPICFKVFEDLFATALTIAYRAGSLGWAERLGDLTVGDNYTRLIPLMEAVPWWLHALWVLAAALYLVAIVLAVLGHRLAYIPILIAVGVEFAAFLGGRPIIAATGVVANPNPSFLAAVVLPYLLPLVIALALWWTNRRPGSLLSAN